MDKIQEVKKRADILKVAEYLGLSVNKSGKCLCPFHSEKTPSLSISTKKQIWKCFGCNKGRRCNITCIGITKYKCI